MRHPFTKFLTWLLLWGLAATGQATPSASVSNELEQAYYLRQYAVLARKLNELGNKKEVQAEIFEVALAVATRQKNKEAQLEALIERHPDVAQVRYFAGQLWYQLKEQSSLLNKLGLVEKSNQNFILAAKLAPENPQYLVEASKALAYQSGFFDSEKKASKMMVEKLAQLDKRFYYLALMDYLQNTQNAAEAQNTIALVRAEYRHDVLLMTRAANLLWTFSEQSEAQHLFVQSCQIKPIKLDQRSTWQEACLSAAYLALQNFGDQQQALAALNILLSEDKVQDEQYVEYLTLLGELNQATGNKDAAVKSYQQALALTTVIATKNNLQKALKKISD